MESGFAELGGRNTWLFDTSFSKRKKEKEEERKKKGILSSTSFRLPFFPHGSYLPCVAWSVDNELEFTEFLWIPPSTKSYLDGLRDHTEAATFPSFGLPAEILVRKTPISCAVRAVINIIFQEVSCMQIWYLQRGRCMVSFWCGVDAYSLIPGNSRTLVKASFAGWLWSSPAFRNHNSRCFLPFSMGHLLAKCWKCFNSLNLHYSPLRLLQFFPFSLLSAVDHWKVFLTDISCFSLVTLSMF